MRTTAPGRQTTVRCRERRSRGNFLEFTLNLGRCRSPWQKAQAAAAGRSGASRRRWSALSDRPLCAPCLPRGKLTVTASTAMSRSSTRGGRMTFQGKELIPFRWANAGLLSGTPGYERCMDSAIGVSQSSSLRIPKAVEALASVLSSVTRGTPSRAQTARCRESPARRPVVYWSAYLAASPNSRGVIVTRVKLSSTSDVKTDKASARCFPLICRVRTLIDNAAENSVTTQSLMASAPPGFSASHFCMKAVRCSRVSAATSTLVSRYSISIVHYPAVRA